MQVEKTLIVELGESPPPPEYQTSLLFQCVLSWSIVTDSGNVGLNHWTETYFAITRFPQQTVWFLNAIWILDSPTICLLYKWMPSCFLMYWFGIQMVGLVGHWCVSSTCTRHCVWIEYAMSQPKFESIIPFYSEFIILSLARIWTQDLSVASHLATHWAMTTWYL